MILVIDNYDSFTYNLVQALRSLGREVRVVKNDEIDVDGIAALKPDGVRIYLLLFCRTRRCMTTGRRDAISRWMWRLPRSGARICWRFLSGNTFRSFASG